MDGIDAAHDLAHDEAQVEDVLRTVEQNEREPFESTARVLDKAHDEANAEDIADLGKDSHPTP